MWCKIQRYAVVYHDAMQWCTTMVCSENLSPIPVLSHLVPLHYLYILPEILHTSPSIYKFPHNFYINDSILGRLFCPMVSLLSYLEDHFIEVPTELPGLFLQLHAVLYPCTTIYLTNPLQ